MKSGPSTSSAQADDRSEPTENTDVLSKQAQQNENYQKQLKTLQAEEKGLNSILLELRSHSRKLNIEKYRLLNLCKEKQEKEAPAQDEQNPGPSANYGAFQF